MGPRGGNCANIHLRWTSKFVAFYSPTVQRAEGQFIAEKLGCRFVETSAKLGSNVTETFIDLVCEIRDRNRVGLIHFFSELPFFSFFACRLSFIFIIWDGSLDLTPHFALFYFYLSLCLAHTVIVSFPFPGDARDAPRFTALHSGQCHPIARCRVLEQGLHRFLIHRRTSTERNSTTQQPRSSRHAPLIPDIIRLNSVFLIVVSPPCAFGD